MSTRTPNPHLLKARSLHESLIFFHGPSHKEDNTLVHKKTDMRQLKRICARQLH